MNSCELVCKYSMSKGKPCILEEPCIEACKNLFKEDIYNEDYWEKPYEIIIAGGISCD